ncbi:LOW QUALITY PROTEIN: transcriptional enhancer factor TEF-1-like [Clytia hemisphaerica]|uniref:LOW QUALITY PROTEIN: transcriptional enhancer factor TEF-1-like n=1 Tax=Clytia hemisphaerica TaxID=252671 RepID=UPI0034D6D8B2
MASDAEGVWSPDIEQSFQEALAIYPPCGRRKIILSDEGKMYGRNELIARYIKLRTGKTRSRKQVSSHIQVLARRKARDIQDSQSKDKALQAMANNFFTDSIWKQLHPSKLLEPAVKRELNLSPQNYWPSPQNGVPPPPAPPIGYPFTTASAFYASTITQASTTSHAQGINSDRHSSSRTLSNPTSPTIHDGPPPPLPHSSSLQPNNTTSSPPWQTRHSQNQMPLRLLDFSAYIEIDKTESYHKHVFVNLNNYRIFEDPGIESIDIRQIYDKFPEKKGGLKELYEKGPQNLFFLVKFWADLNTNISDDAAAAYRVSSTYESTENMTITCSTKVCSFGKQVVEKVETEFSSYENGRYVYRIHRSAMCEYMINFIHKLKHLPEKFMMNSVLENFTILQVVTNRQTQETLLCLAFVFEVSSNEHGAQHNVFKLVKD